MNREFTFRWLDAETASMLRQIWRETGLPVGNDYYWIQYKNGRVVCYDHSYDEEKIPSLNLNDVLFVSDWFAGEGGGYGECYINRKLPYEKIQEIILSELYNEDGEFCYDEVNSSRDFPLKQFEPFIEGEPDFIL